MLMSTAAGWLDVDDDVDPDTLKVPETPEHRRIVDAIGIVAAHHLSPDITVYRDMNWYPPDQGHALAPDIMTLPAQALPRDAKSYRQSTTELPWPLVVVEVPSPTDSYDGMRLKAARYNSLGVDVYVISTDPVVGAERFAPGQSGSVTWTGRPIEPLGGLSIEVVDGRVAIRTPEGVLISTDAELLKLLTESRTAARAAAAAARAAEAAASSQAAADRARTLELEAKLRALGVEP